MRWQTYTTIARDVIRNTAQTTELAYVVGPAKWVIRNVGKQIVEELVAKKVLTARITATSRGLSSAIVHFGSLPALFTHNKPHSLERYKKVVVTAFHIVPEREERTEAMLEQQNEAVIHTTCTITQQKLIELGADPEKIVIIPLCVDTTIFKQAQTNERQQLRKELGIAADRIVIGSFQKDGAGWEAGNEAKREKGPDVLVQTLTRAAQQHPVHVVLVGPARGYVRTQLERKNIPYTNIGFLENYEDVARYYHALDAYLITSRIEGGPLGLLEAWASGVPVVSTRVGMVPDNAVHEETALIADSEDSTSLADHIGQLAGNTDLSNRLVTKALKEVEKYTIPIIAQRYYSELYKPLLLK